MSPNTFLPKRLKEIKGIRNTTTETVQALSLEAKELLCLKGNIRMCTKRTMMTGFCLLPLLLSFLFFQSLEEGRITFI